MSKDIFYFSARGSLVTILSLVILTSQSCAKKSKSSAPQDAPRLGEPQEPLRPSQNQDKNNGTEVPGAPAQPGAGGSTQAGGNSPVQGPTGGTAGFANQVASQKPAIPAVLEVGNVHSRMNEVQNLLKQFDFELGEYVLSGFTQSLLEKKLEHCANKDIRSIQMQVSGNSFSLVNTGDYKACMSDFKSNTAGKWDHQSRYSFGATCSLSNFSAYHGKFLTDPLITLGFCSDAAAGEMNYNLQVGANEFNPDGVKRRAYNRTKVLTAKNGKGCLFTGSNGVRQYTDCVWIDRIDGLNGVIHYVSVDISGLKSKISGDSFIYAGGSAKIVIDDWEGEIIFPAEFEQTVNWTLKKKDGTSKTGTIKQNSKEQAQSVPVIPKPSTSSGSSTKPVEKLDPLWTVPGQAIYQCLVGSSPSPFNVAFAAYRGRFKVHGISSYANFCFELAGGKVSIKILIDLMIKEGCLKENQATDSYRNALELQIRSVCH
jgi:hypothetical protein